MPIAKLFVEGTVDFQVLTPILAGNPVLQQGGSKYSLRPRAATERRENKVEAGYLRDRDFDFDPPNDTSHPTADASDAKGPFGWRWCRHEIESYLIDPGVVSEVIGSGVGDVEDAIRSAGAAIRYYEAARWTVGVVRRSLPPQYDLRTRPEGLSDIELPSALTIAAASEWARDSIEAYRRPLTNVTAVAVVQESFDGFAERFDDVFVADVTQILLWFSGKDLLAGMADWLSTRAIGNPGLLRARVRDWIIANPERTLELLPEWNGMIAVMRA